MADKHYVGEVGTVLTVNTGIDISAATVHDLYVKKGDGSITTWTGTVYASNYIRYTIQSGDFNVPGTYKVQAKITLGSWIGYGEVASFYVNPIIS